MNSNPYNVPAAIALVVCAVLCIGLIAAHLVIGVLKPPARGRHIRPAAGLDERHTARADVKPLPDITDEADEPGEPDDSCQPDWLDEDELDAGWWAQHAPMPAAAGILAAPGTRPVLASTKDMGALARLRDALLPDAWKPLPGEVTFTPADPEPTCTDLQPVTQHADVIP